MAKINAATQIEGAYTTMVGVTMATARLLGRTTASAGVAEEISVGSGLSLTGGVLGVSTVPVANGGTGIASYAVGDIPYASASTTLSKLAAVATGSILASAGVTTAPVWSNSLNLGTDTWTKAALSAGEIALDNGTNVSPGIRLYTAANANWGIYNNNNTIQFVKNLQESGGVVRMTLDNNGLLVLAYPGPVVMRLTDSAGSGGSFDIVSNVVGSTATCSITDGAVYLFSVQKTTSRVGIKNNAPTAMLHLPAGAAGASNAPLKFTAGTLLGTIEAGAMEWVDDGTTGHLYITQNVAGVLTRVQIV